MFISSGPGLTVFLWLCLGFVCLFEALRSGQKHFSHFGTASWV